MALEQAFFGHSCEQPLTIADGGNRLRMSAAPKRAPNPQEATVHEGGSSAQSHPMVKCPNAHISLGAR